MARGVRKRRSPPTGEAGTLQLLADVDIEGAQTPGRYTLNIVLDRELLARPSVVLIAAIT